MDIDSFIRAVEALDEEELEREVAELREQQRQVSIELNKRLDALAVKRRWEEQKQPGASGALSAFGVAQDAQERVRLHSDPAQMAPVEPPRGIEAVRRVMREGGDWTVRTVHEELGRRGWASPNAKHPLKATETALHRLYQRKEIARVGRGVYRYGTAPAPHPSFENGTGGQSLEIEKRSGSPVDTGAGAPSQT